MADKRSKVGQENAKSKPSPEKTRQAAICADSWHFLKENGPSA